MKRQLIFSILAGMLLSVAVPFAGAQATDWKQVPVPQLHPFHPQQPKRIELPNGMVIFLQEDHELPLIDGVARIRGGSREEPAAKVGLVESYGEAWRTGGTKTKTGDQLDDFLEARAAKVETGGSVDSTTISWSCLKGDFEDVFKLFVELLREPEFRQDKIDLAKDQANTEIARRNDEVFQLAGREAAKLGYGARNPYARVPEYATIAAITRQDLLDWHHDHVHPNNIILGIVGDFDSAALEARLRQAFASWARGPAAHKDDIQFQPVKPGYYLIEKKDVNQSNIRMVDLGATRNNPDYYAIEVFTEAFGGGFSSRLFSNIRSKRGLAYAVGGGVGTAFDHPGLVRIMMGTKSQSTVEAIQALYDEIDDLVKNPISDEEIKRAKDSILNSFIFKLDSPEKVLHERLAYEFYGYPADFLERYRAGIEKVTKDDVARVAAKYLHKDRLAVLVVGNTAEFDKPLSSLGPVTNIDITIPPPPGEKPAEAAPPAASNPEGKALAAKVAEAMGGEVRLKSIKSLRAKFQLVSKTPQGDIPMPVETTLVFPDRMHVVLQSPMGPLTLVFSPTSAFMSGQGTVRDVPESQKTESLGQIKRDLIFIAQHLGDPSFTFTANGAEKIGDAETKIVDVNAAGTPVRWYVEPKTGRILRETYPAMGQSGPVQGQTDMADWKTANGVTLPYKRLNKENGKDSSTVEFTEFDFNPQVDPKVFEKPAP